MASSIPTNRVPMWDNLFHILPKEELDRQMGSLQEIVKRFGKWDDTLSIQIHEWYEKIIDREDSSSVTKKISDLVSDILVNPITRAPLKHPILDGYTVWEASTLQECKEFTKASPVTKEPFEEVERVHEFALAILSWIEPFRAAAPSITEKPQRLFPREENLSSEAIIPYSSWAVIPHEEKKVAAMGIYGRLGGSIRSQRTGQLVRREAERLIATSHARFAEIKAQSEAESAAISQKIEGQRASYAEAMGAVSAKAKLKTDEAQVRMRESAAKEDTATKGIAAAAAVVADNSREVSRLAAELAGMRG